MTQDQREYVTFRLGLMQDSAKSALAAHDDPITKKEREEDDVSFYVYLGDHLLDLTTLSDNSHAIRLPIGTTINRADKITCKVQTTNRLKRMAYARCTTTVGSLQDATTDDKHVAWMALDDGGKALVCQLNKANQSTNKAMSVIVFRGTDIDADSKFDKIQKDKKVVSKRSIYYDTKHNSHPVIHIDACGGCSFCESNNSGKMNLQHIYRSIAAYFRVDKDVIHKLGQLNNMSNHSEWRRLLQLLRAWSKKFEIGCDEHAFTWTNHRAQLNRKINHAQDRLDACVNFKQQIIQRYGSTQKSIKDTNNDCITFADKVTQEAARRRDEKEKLSGLEHACHDTMNQRSQIEAREAYTIACNKGEQGLQQTRHDICIDLLNQAIYDCADQVKFIKNKSLTLQNNQKDIKSATAKQQEVAKVAPMKQKALKDDIKENANKHAADTEQTHQKLKSIMAESKNVMSEHNQKEKELAESNKAMDALLEEQERLRHQWVDGLANTKAKLASLKKSCNDSIDLIHKTGAEAARCKADHEAMKKEVQVLQLNKDMCNDASDLLGRRQNLKQDIDAIKAATNALEQEAASVKHNWLKYYKKTYNELVQRCELNDNAWINEEIENTRRQTVKANDASVLKEISELQKRLESLPAAAQNEEEFQAVIDDAKDKLVRLRVKMNEKIVCYDDIICQSKVLIAVNQQACENENEKMMLEAEIDASIVEVEYKKQLVGEQQTKLDKTKKKYKQLKAKIQEQDDYLFQLRDDINKKDQEIEENEEELARKEKEIASLEEMTGMKAKYGAGDKPEHMQMTISSKKLYKATKGDIVDELLAKIINETNCTLPVRKLGKGFYMFGTKKISCQAKVNSLLVRVGGGYSDFREYLIKNGDQEADRIAASIAAGDWNEEEVYQFYLGEVNPHLAQQRGTVAHGRGKNISANTTSRTSIAQDAIKSATGMSRKSVGGSPRASTGRQSMSGNNKKFE